MITNLDGDIIPYEVGAVCQNFRTERKVMDKVDQLIEFILERTGASQYEIFLSEPPNFRDQVALVKKYKGQRLSEKPQWWFKIREYLYEHYEALRVVGCEADDMLSIKQHDYNARGIKSCIASRDKDLRIVPGWHYSWPCGDNQPEKPLYTVEHLGELWPKWGKPSRTGNVPLSDLKGCGLKFFYAQLIMGDTADNIPGAPGKGNKIAYESIKDCTSEEEMYRNVVEVYRSAYSRSTKTFRASGGYVLQDDWRGKTRLRHFEDILREMGILLWMQSYKGEVWSPPT